MTDTKPRRRWALPAVCLPLAVLGLSAPALWDWLDVLPAWRMKAAHAGLAVAVGCVIALALWYFRLAGFSRKTKLAGVALLALAVAAGFALVREVDFTGDMRPIPRWRWQPSAARLFDESRRDAERATGDVDLRVDDVRDFPRYRGARGDGVVTPLELFATSWDEEPKVVWRKRCGGGFSGFAVAGNVAVTHEQRDADEAVVCYDRATGAERWACAYPALFRDAFGDGPRSTPTIHEGRIYALGATGLLTCVEGTTGKRVWQEDVLGDGNRPVTWGVSGSPLVVDDAVVVAVGGKEGPSLAAYALGDGKRRWTGGAPGGGYGSPTLATLAGRRQVLLFDAGGLAGFDPADGKELWRHEWATFMGMNIVQPIVLSGDRVFLSSEASNGAAMLQVVRSGDGFSVSLSWETKDMGSKFSNPVAVGEAVYGLSTGRLVCLHQRTGERLWRGTVNYGHGQILAAGGSLVVLSERGALALVAADPGGFRQQAFRRLFDDKTWNTPAMADRRLFVRNAAEMACVELPRR